MKTNQVRGAKIKRLMIFYAPFILSATYGLDTDSVNNSKIRVSCLLFRNLLLTASFSFLSFSDSIFMHRIYIFINISNLNGLYKDLIALNLICLANGLHRAKIKLKISDIYVALNLLFSKGLDYRHGTGHGIGAYLQVSVLID